MCLAYDLLLHSLSLRSKKLGYEIQRLITNPSQMNSLFLTSYCQIWPDGHSFVLLFVDIRGSANAVSKDGKKIAKTFPNYRLFIR